MNNKKESSIINIFVYLLIVVFIILIALPPLARIFFKEETARETPTEEEQLPALTSLNCRREVEVDTMVYDITVNTNYNDDEISKVTFTYLIPEVVDDTVSDDANPVMSEINMIRDSGIIEDESTDTEYRFILTKELKEEHPDSTSLDSFFQPIEEQETTLESFGYTCSTLTA